MANVDFNYFLQEKDGVVWKQHKTFQKHRGTISHLTWKGFRLKDGKPESIPGFFLHILADKESSKVILSLTANMGYDIAGSNQQKIDSFTLPSGLKSFEDGTLEETMRERYNVSGNTTLHQNKSGYNPTLPPRFQKGNRTMIHSSGKFVRNIYLNEVQKNEEQVYVVRVITVDSATNKIIEGSGNIRHSIADTLKEGAHNFSTACSSSYGEGYVYLDSYKGEVPDFAKMNFNTLFSPDVQTYIQNEFWEETIDLMMEDDADSAQDWNFLSSNNLPVKESQDVGGQWYQGQMPDPSNLIPNIGGPSVDSSQIQGIFSGAGESISLVNQFNGQLLTNIAWIYNSSGNAFGVYFPAIDKALKDEEVKQYMKSKGYLIEETGQGNFVAYPNSEDIPQEKVEQDMQEAYHRAELQGGNSIGLDVSKILGASQADIDQIGITDSWEQNFIKVIHLGGTMVHEAVHANGDKGEAGPEAEEARFMQWALDKLNEERKSRWDESEGEQFAPYQMDLTNKRQAFSKGWYRQSQYGAQFQTVAPADQAGQFTWSPGKGLTEGLLNQTRLEVPMFGPLEKRMRNLEKLKWDDRPDTRLTLEELLSKDHRGLNGYKHLETLMEDERPKPLMLPIKNASLQKIAFFSEPDIFWHGRNIQGGLVPTMRERVIPRAEMDDFLNFDWGNEGRDPESPAAGSDSAGHGGAVHEQPRYNPEYDSMGMYQRIREPRWQPELWDKMISERPSRTNPAARWASDSVADTPEDMKEVLEALEHVDFLIEEKIMQGSRFLASPDIADGIRKFFEGSNKVVLMSQSVGELNGETIYPVWVLSADTPKSQVLLAEQYTRGERDDSEAEKSFNDILGMDSAREQALEEIISEARDSCKRYGIEDVYLVGGYPRALAMQDPKSEVRDLDFSGSWPEECRKLGGLLAEKLGVQDTEYYHRTMTLTWEWRDIKCDFRGEMGAVRVRDLMRKKGIKTTPLNLDVYSRDLTINMLVCELGTGKVYDVCKSSMKDIREKRIRTFFDPEITIKRNPLVIMRAMKFAVRYGFEIAPEFRRAIESNCHYLFGGKITEERLAAGLDDLLLEGKEEVDTLIRSFGLDKLYEISDKIGG